MVTKEQLLQRVWPDAFVEEGSISNNISALRKILNPDFEGEGPIQTVARRGYRFSAAVRLRNAQAEIALVSGALPAAPAPAAAVGVVDVPQGKPPSAGLRTHGTPRIVLTRGKSGSRPACSSCWRRSGSSSRRDRAPASELPAGSTVRRSVAVLPMKNLSGDAAYGWFSTALAETIAAELAAGGQLRLISGAAVAEMQQELSPPPGVGLNRKQLDEIGRNLGSDSDPHRQLLAFRRPDSRRGAPRRHRVRSARRLSQRDRGRTKVAGPGGGRQPRASRQARPLASARESDRRVTRGAVVEPQCAPVLFPRTRGVADPRGRARQRAAHTGVDRRPEFRPGALGAVDHVARARLRPACPGRSQARVRFVGPAGPGRSVGRRGRLLRGDVRLAEGDRKVPGALEFFPGQHCVCLEAGPPAAARRKAGRGAARGGADEGVAAAGGQRSPRECRGG